MPPEAQFIKPKVEGEGIREGAERREEVGPAGEAGETGEKTGIVVEGETTTEVVEAVAGDAPKDKDGWTSVMGGEAGETHTDTHTHIHKQTHTHTHTHSHTLTHTHTYIHTYKHKHTHTHIHTTHTHTHIPCLTPSHPFSPRPLSPVLTNTIKEVVGEKPEYGQTV
jgi:hypothetical protein